MTGPATDDLCACGCGLPADECVPAATSAILGVPKLGDQPPLRVAIDADCPSCGYPERFYEPARQVFGCSSLNPQPCGYESTEREA